MSTLYTLSSWALGHTQFYHPHLTNSIVLLFFVQPLITALLLRWVSREARALRQTASAYRRLSFVVVSGMVLALLSELLWYLSLMLGGMPSVVLPPVICATVIIAICTFLDSHKSTLPHPKDPPPFDLDSPLK